jgi:hypothetical protein
VLNILQRPNHISVGIYASGNFVINIVHPDDLAYHIEYNKSRRPGRALIVDGESLNNGYLKDDAIEEWKTKIAAMDINSARPTIPYQ